MSAQAAESRGEHLSVDALRRMEDAGLLSRQDPGPFVRHLGETCPTCAAAITRWRRTELPALEHRPEDYEPAIRRALDRVGEQLRAQLPAPNSREEVDELLRLAPEERQARVTGDRRLARPGVVEALFAAARLLLAHGSPEAAEVASLAEALALRIPAGSIPLAVQLDFVAEATLLRAQGELVLSQPNVAARTALAAQGLAHDGAGSPCVSVELIATGALLAWAFAHPEDTLTGWKDLHHLARQLQDPTLRAHALLAEAATYALLGDLPHALQLRAQAADIQVGPHWIGVMEAVAGWAGQRGWGAGGEVN